MFIFVGLTCRFVGELLIVAHFAKGNINANNDLQDKMTEANANLAYLHKNRLTAPSR